MKINGVSTAEIWDKLEKTGKARVEVSQSDFELIRNNLQHKKSKVRKELKGHAPSQTLNSKYDEETSIATFNLVANPGSHRRATRTYNGRLLDD